MTIHCQFVVCLLCDIIMLTSDCVCSGIEPPDAGREKDGIQALQALEVGVEHSVSDSSLSCADKLGQNEF